MTEAAYYHEHSALADSDATEEEAKSQIRDARENRERRLGGVVMRLVDDVPGYIESPLTKFLAGDEAWADLAVEGLAGVAIAVATIRELCTGESDIEAAKLEHSK